MRCNVQVVPKIMFDVEVHVQAWHVQALADETIDVRLSVPQFVRNVDAICCQEDARGK